MTDERLSTPDEPRLTAKALREAMDAIKNAPPAPPPLHHPRCRAVETQDIRDCNCVPLR